MLLCCQNNGRINYYITWTTHIHHHSFNISTASHRILYWIKFNNLVYVLYLSKHTNTHIVYCFISFLYATYTHPYKCGFIHISCVHVSSKPQISLAPPLVNTQKYTPLNTIGCLLSWLYKMK